MARMEPTNGIQNPFGKAVLSMGYWVAVVLAFLLVFLMVKLVARHHGSG